MFNWYWNHLEAVAPVVRVEPVPWSWLLAVVHGQSRAWLPAPRLLQPRAPCKGKSFLFRICDLAIDLLGNKSVPMSLKGRADQKNNRQVDVGGFFFPFPLQFFN